MNAKTIVTLLLAAAVFAPTESFAQEKKARKEKKDSWKDNLTPTAEKMSSTGRNTYFILEPGYQLMFEGEDEGKKAELVITVLDETKKIGDVETRIIEERESLDGKIVEISRNYFTIGVDTKTAYYFGEDVDMYKDGKITDHGGSWIAGENDAKLGIIIPGQVKVGDRYYQERAPKVAMDRAEHISITETMKTPAGEFKNCLKTKETTPLEPDTAYKTYAPEVGLLNDGPVKLVKYGFIKKQAGLITADGQIDLAALKKLKKSEGAKAIPAVASAYKDSRITDAKLKEPLGRFALSFAGADPAADKLYHTAINDAGLAEVDRANLIEDLNEVGYENLKSLTPGDQKLIASRLDLIKRFRADSDPKLAPAFDEAEKDLRSMAK